MLVSVLGAPAISVAESAKAATPKPRSEQAILSSPKSAEERYLNGLDCLQAKDAVCASVALAGINPASPYAKLLRGQIATLANDWETPLRLLIPLQAETDLLPQAYGSLHATLAFAYEAQGNTLNALEQYVKSEPFMARAEDVADTQARIWKMLSAQAREALVEMRGESPDPVVQGWVDLALAVAFAEKRARNIDQWRAAYPDHPAGEVFLTALSAVVGGQEDASMPPATVMPGKVALLLPLGSLRYAAAAQAVLDGFMAAHAAAASRPEVAVYATGEAEATVAAYQLAVAEGAQSIVGPLTRDEVTALAAETLAIPTLALNMPEGEFKGQYNLAFYGLSAEAEARQVARLARVQGLQTALVIVGENPLSQRMGKAFAEAWQTLDGNISRQLDIPAADRLPEFKAEAATHPADMIFLAAGADQARLVRPYLDRAIPTYGTSHIYDGAPKSIQNMELLAVHFVDMPWMIEPGGSGGVGNDGVISGETRRLFALGRDAYRLLPELAVHPQPGRKLLDGATGTISMGHDGVLVRELPMAQFRNGDVVLEPIQ